MKPTRVRSTSFENGEWWYIRPNGKRERVASYLKKNDTRMFVAGKYVSKSHPLHKPGNYKTFEQAAFQSLGKYKELNEGFVYIISNKAWQGWIKVGRAADVQDRFKHYQTFSPFRDYKLEYGKFVTDCKKIELLWHKKLSKMVPHQKEWYKIHFVDAILELDGIIYNEEKKS